MIVYLKRNLISKESLGIIGICLVMFGISNYSNILFLNLFNLVTPNLSIMFLNRILLWVGLFLFFIYVKFYLKKEFLPWDEKNYSVIKTFLSIVILLGFLIAGFIALVLVIQALNISTQGNAQEGINLLYRNLPLMIFTCFTAAVLEEILFRGYIFPTISIMTNSSSMGIIVSSIFFGLMHFSYGSFHQVIIPIYFGIVFSTFYLKFRSLKIIVFCHFIWNLVVYLDSAGLLL